MIARKPLVPGVIGHTDKQLAAGRKRAQAKASWSTPRFKKLPALADFQTPAPVERGDDGRFRKSSNPKRG